MVELAYLLGPDLEEVPMARWAEREEQPPWVSQVSRVLWAYLKSTIEH